MEKWMELYMDGTNHYRNKKYKESIDSFTKSLTLAKNINTPDETIATIYYNRGVVYAAMPIIDKKLYFSKAINDYFECLKHFVKDKNNTLYPECINKVGELHFNVGEYDESIDKFTQAINVLTEQQKLISDEKTKHKISVFMIDCFYNRGLSYHKKKMFKSALTDYNKCLELNPKYIKCLNSRGNLFTETNNNDLALKDFNKCIELNPKDSISMHNKVKVLIILNRNQDALDALNKFLQKNTKDSLNLYNRGKVRNLMGLSVRDVLDDYSESIRLDQTNNEYLNGRGFIYACIGDMVQALKDYNKAIEIKNDFVECLYNRANLYFDMGDNGNALKDIEKCIEIAGKSDYYLNFKTKIFRRNELQKVSTSKNLANNVILLNLNKLPLIDSAEISLGKVLYTDSKTNVYKGMWKKGQSNEQIDVTVKTTLVTKNMDKFITMEVNAAKMLTSDRIVKVYGYYVNVELNIVHVVMEPCEYKTNNTFNNKINTTIQICKAVDSIHRKGIVHCNINPFVFLTDKNDATKLTGFGYSEFVEGTSLLMPLINGLYTAPELISKDGRKLYSVKGDVYAMGLVLYYIWVGKEAVVNNVSGKIIGKQDKGLIEDVIWEIITGCINPVPEHRLAVPVILKMLSKKYAERVPVHIQPKTALSFDLSKEVLCPISKRVFDDPVYFPTTRTIYEREALLDAFDKATASDGEDEVDEFQRLGLFVCPKTNRKAAVLENLHEDESMVKLVEIYKKYGDKL